MAELAIPMILIVLAAFVLPVVVGLRTGTLKLVAPAAAVITVLCLWVAWSSTGDKTTWDSTSLRGSQTVQIESTGGECEDRRSVSVDESDESVTVSIKTWSFASACSDVGVIRKVTVHLGEPLGKRSIVDGNCSGSRCARPISR